MSSRLVVQGLDDEVGAVARRPLRSVEHQVVMTCLRRIGVEVFADEATARAVDLLDLAGRRLTVQVETAAEGGDAVLAVADQKDAQGGARRQNVRRPAADEDAAALLAEGADDRDQAEEVAAVAQLRPRRESLKALQQPALAPLVDLLDGRHRQMQFAGDVLR